MSNVIDLNLWEWLDNSQQILGQQVIVQSVQMGSNEQVINQFGFINL